MAHLICILVPKHQKEKENNWIQSNKGEFFFVYIRLYGPEEGFFDQTYPMNKIKLTN